MRQRRHPASPGARRGHNDGARGFRIAVSALSKKLAAGTFVVTTELTPPKGTDLADLLAKAEALHDHVDGINLTDSPRARMAVTPVVAAKFLLDRGLEPIVQFTTRDRNRIALQADLLGAAALGVGNAVFMGGDHPSHGDHTEAKAVFDVTTIELLQVARALNEGRDMAGNPLKGSPSLLLGATVNPGAQDFEREIDNTRRKIDAGAVFLQTQAIYDAASLRRFVDVLKPEGVDLLAGIIPLKSSKMGAWLNGNVPGIHVPAALIDAMDRVAGGTQAELEIGIELCARIIADVRSYCSGIHLMTMGWERHIPSILQASGLSKAR